MRAVWVIVGIGAVVVVSAGVWTLASQQVPPQISRPAAVASTERIAPSPAAPAPAIKSTRLEVRRLLLARDFAALTRMIEEKQAAVEADILREGDLALVIDTFDTADPALAQAINEWASAQPASFAPRLARAQYGVAVGWARRGSKYANKTTADQFEGLGRALASAVEDASAALERNPRLGEAYRVLIRAEMAFGETESCVRLGKEALTVVPASARVRSALANCLLPRWGGSYSLIEELAKEADQHVTRNPSLAGFHGYVAWDRGNLATDHAEELAHYTRAIEAGGLWFYYDDRAGSYLRNRRYNEALADAERALALAPEKVNIMILRARALIGLGRAAEALPDVRFVAEVDPTNADLARFRQHELETGAYDGYTLIQSSDFNGAIARLTSTMDLTGGNAEVYYWRGRAHLLSNDHERALSDFEEAIRRDARHFESCRNIDFLLAKRGDWDGVIRRWTQYLELEPSNGDAYFERAGAHKQKGDMAAALEDVRKACDLGTQAACEIARRSGLQ